MNALAASSGRLMEGASEFDQIIFSTADLNARGDPSNFPGYSLGIGTLVSRARTYSTLSALFLAALPLSTRAEELENVRLDYAAVAGCPAASTFSDEVRARTKKAVFSATASGPRFRVRLERAGSDYVGRLEIVEPDGKRSERSIDGESCVDVVSALALAAALAIDPDASTLPRSELPPPAPITAPQAPATRPARRPSARQGPRAGLGLALGLAAGAVRGPAPETLVVAGASVDLFRQSAGLNPALRLTLLGAETGILGAESELATFRWAAVRSELCPHRLGALSSVSFRACALVDAGLLYARGDAAEEPGSAARGWLSLGLGLGLDLAVTSQLSVGLSVGESVNVLRDDFVFLETPKRRVHEVPLTTQSALFGASWRLL